MRHLKSGKKLSRTASHRKATLQSLASALFEHKRIHTTQSKAKALRPYAEKLITKAKKAINNEQNGKLPNGQNVDVHNRREVGKELKKKYIVQELFDSIAPVVIDRNGGYTRIVKLGRRRGDSAETAIIELVDWSSEQDPAFAKDKTKKSKTQDTPTSKETAKKDTKKKAKVESKEAKKEETTEKPKKTEKDSSKKGESVKKVENKSEEDSEEEENVESKETSEPATDESTEETAEVEEESTDKEKPKKAKKDSKDEAEADKKAETKSKDASEDKKAKKKSEENSEKEFDEDEKDKK